MTDNQIAKFKPGTKVVCIKTERTAYLEPRRVSRRLRILKKWSHDEEHSDEIRP
jgi:hypothetical protein